MCLVCRKTCLVSRETRPISLKNYWATEYAIIYFQKAGELLNESKISTLQFVAESIRPKVATKSLIDFRYS